jgi:hypothetical protein
LAERNWYFGDSVNSCNPDLVLAADGNNSLNFF